MNEIAERLAQVRQRIEAAAKNAGRQAESVRLIAVSKVHPSQAIRAAYEAGQRDFAENYAQELAQKAEELADLPDLRWHMIGHLQSNKARLVAPVAAVVHTIHSPRLAGILGRRAAALGRTIDVLIEVNIANDPAKSGCMPEEVEAILGAIQREPSLRARGLMTVPPFTEDPEGAGPFFEALRELRDRFGGIEALPELSMGMTHDLDVAVAEGATMVRVGTGIFGARPEN